MSSKQPYRLEIELIGLPRRFNQGHGAHWAIQHQESVKWHKRLLGKMILTRTSPPPLPLERAKVTLVRHSSTSPDYDGLVQSMKPVVDALKKSLVIADDNMRTIGKPQYDWVKAPPGAGKIQVIVEEIILEQETTTQKLKE